MDIVWHKGQVPRKMELADNGDFDRSANMKCVLTRCNLSRFTMDVYVAGKITEKFPSEVEDDYVEIMLSHAEDEEAVFCCCYTPDGLQCVHIATSFLIAYGGIVIAPRNEERMKTFVEMLMQELSEKGAFREIREQQVFDFIQQINN